MSENYLNKPFKLAQPNEMARLAELFHQKEKLHVHTGNINAWAPLKVRRFQNSAEELWECLKLQLNAWNPSEETLKDVNTLCLCESDQCQPCSSLGTNERNDLKVSLKVFLSRWDFDQVRQCLNSVLYELQTDAVDQLIISFPELEDDFDTDEEENAAMLEAIKPIWTGLEDLALDSKRALSVGVADLEAGQLKTLYDWAPRVKPNIDHYNIADCCTVPPELKEFAQANDIQLLTHNDPKVFLDDGSLHEICTQTLGVDSDHCRKWRPSWIGRYGVMIRKRSVMIAKGFVVEFEKRASCEGRETVDGLIRT